MILARASISIAISAGNNANQLAASAEAAAQVSAAAAIFDDDGGTERPAHLVAPCRRQRIAGAAGHKAKHDAHRGGHRLRAQRRSGKFNQRANNGDETELRIDGGGS